ncbi:MAG: 2TM domain-containing protein [Bacteroidetes bacterium]|nr:2TM domain-containing protein [Bacteroidota bacterium]
MENIQTEKERMLWKEAKKRVGFRNHLITYLAINLLLWVMWYFTGRQMEDGLPWPTFCTLGWGFGIFWHFMGSFVFNNKLSQVEKEFERLKAKSN